VARGLVNNHSRALSFNHSRAVARIVICNYSRAVAAVAGRA
jgi:hypothetical protein